MFASQVELFNDNLKVLYHEKHYGPVFLKCGIKIPELLTCEATLDFLIKALENKDKKSFKK